MGGEGGSVESRHAPILVPQPRPFLFRVQSTIHTEAGLASEWIMIASHLNSSDLWFFVVIRRQAHSISKPRACGKMAPRMAKPAKNRDEGTSSQPSKRGRKPDFEKTMHTINAYTARIPLDIRSQINGWECELRDISDNKEIPCEDWEDLILNPGTTRGRNSLFNKTLQQYWIMKHVVGWAMEVNQAVREEEDEERKQVDEQLKS